MKTDAIIIGGGIVGCATAYYLAKSGIKALVIEKEPGVGLHASGRNGGGVRQHGRKKILSLAMASVRLWAGLREELQSELEYIRSGNLVVAIDDLSIEILERDLSWEHQHGLTEVRMVTAEECGELAPGLFNRVKAGKYCPTDGVANPMLVTPAFARAGFKSGVKFLYNTRVTSLMQQGTVICGVKTPSDEILAPIVINTAGPWAPQFTSQAGCDTPIYPGRSQLMIIERVPNLKIKPWITVRGFGYMRPTASGNLVLGTSGAANQNYSQHVNFFSAARQATYWAKLFPFLEGLSIIRAFSGITEYTPDADPYIGAVPGVSGLLVGAGFHGEGFCTGPMVGKILADLAIGKAPDICIEPFRPGRFSSPGVGTEVPPIEYPLDKMFLDRYTSIFN